VTFSPDGRRVAFASDRAGSYDVYVMDADGQSPTRLTNDPGRESAPVWR
jgi:TolB protein